MYPRESVLARENGVSMSNGGDGGWVLFFVDS